VLTRPLRICAFAAILVTAGCATIVPAPRTEAPAAVPTESWARVLDRFVDDHGRVDFENLARDRRDLDRYVAWVYAVGPNSNPGLFPTRADVVAYHLNAYNALAMYNVLESGIPTTLGGLKKVDFFFVRRVQVGGVARSLYSYENDVIRKLGDERVHFALNCMVVGCPRLPREPFRDDTLDAVLEREARFFFSEPRNLEPDDARRTVRMSEILKFYTADFLAKERSLIAYVNRYRTTPIPADYRIEFIPYDWTVNRQPGRSALPGARRGYTRSARACQYFTQRAPNGDELQALLRAESNAPCGYCFASAT
jgi:hypothetical protein